jgi:membrane fusion protein, multidrug efflux system
MVTQAKPFYLRPLFAIAAASAVVAAVLGLANLREQRANASPALAAANVIELAAADLIDVKRGELRQSISITGTLMPRNWTAVKAKAAGEVRELLVREGEAVKAGQVVARIDTTEAQAKLQEKIADLEGGKAQLAYATRNREQQLQLMRQNFISQNAFENTQSNYLVAEARLNALQAQVAMARKALDDTVVRAPISGIVAERFAQPGEKVAVDGKLLTVVNLGEFEVEAAVPASDIPSVRIGQEVSFSVEGFDERAFSGRIDRINPSTQTGTRSILVYAVVPNRDGVLKGGLFAKGSLTVDKREQVLLLPITALREESGQTGVWRVSAGKLALQSVKTGMRNEAAGLVEILSGLEPGEKVVKTNLGTLRAGAEVRLAQAR